MKKQKKFNVGDKVFAKMKGYSPWPAIVTNENGKKFEVKFYGTGETGQIRVEDIFYFNRFKNRLKPSKRKEYDDAIKEIEAAISEIGTDGDPEDGDNTEYVADNSLEDSNNPLHQGKSSKRNRSSSRRSLNTKHIKLSSTPLPKKKGNIPSSEANPTVEDISIEETNTTNVNFEEDFPFKVEKESAVDKDIRHDKSHGNKLDIQVIASEDIISEHELNSFIAYGNYIESHEDLYKSAPIEKRYDSPKHVLPIVLESSKAIGIKLHKTWPLKFQNEYDRALYDKKVAEELLRLKNLSQKNDLDQCEFFYISNMDQKQIDNIKEENLDKLKKVVLDKISIEARLLHLDAKIKGSLGLNKANPDVAILYLEQMLDLSITEVMLKKHIHLIDLVRRLRKYVGDTHNWHMDALSVEEFRNKAEKIRALAEAIYVKIKGVVTIPTDVPNFWDAFNEVVGTFREQTKSLSEDEYYLLGSEPFSREAIIFNYIIKKC